MPVNLLSCEVTAAHYTIVFNHVILVVSVMPLSHVSPSRLFNSAIMSYSMTTSVESLAQSQSD